jgi:hypothetical protein
MRAFYTREKVVFGFFPSPQPSLRRLILTHIWVMDTGKLKKVGELVNNRRLLNSPPGPLSLKRGGEAVYSPFSSQEKGVGGMSSNQ